MARGRAVFVEGRLRQDTWETEVGERRSRLKVVAHRVTFLPRNGAAAGDEASVESIAEDA